MGDGNVCVACDSGGDGVGGAGAGGRGGGGRRGGRHVRRHARRRARAPGALVQGRRRAAHRPTHARYVPTPMPDTTGQPRTTADNSCERLKLGNERKAYGRFFIYIQDSFGNALVKYVTR